MHFENTFKSEKYDCKSTMTGLLLGTGNASRSPEFWTPASKYLMPLAVG